MERLGLIFVASTWLACSGASTTNAADASTSPDSPSLDAGTDSTPSDAAESDADATSVDGDASTAPIELGAWPGEPSHRLGTDADALTYLQSEIGKMPNVILFYTGVSGAFPQSTSDEIVAAGSIPMITLQPGGSTVPDSAWTLATTLSGAHDAEYIAWAKGAKAWGKTFYLRFAHEMNSKSYPWGTVAGNLQGNTPDQYIAAWKYVRKIFADQGVTNAIWVWCPASASSSTFVDNFPGDDQVDWIGFDEYNRGTDGAMGWLDPISLYSSAYSTLTKLSKKPISISETSSVEDGGDKAAWIGKLLDLRTKMPQVRMLVWFDAIHTDKAGVTFDWRIDTTPASLAAFQSLAASGVFGVH